MTTKKALFEPRDVAPEEFAERQRSPTEIASEVLRSAGIDAKFVPIIVEHLPRLEPLAKRQSDGENVPALIRTALAIAEDAIGDTSEASLANFARGACGVFRMVGDRDEVLPRLRDLMRALRAAGADFEAVLRSFVPRPGGGNAAGMARALWQLDVIDVRKLISVERLKDSGAKVGAFPKTWSSERERVAQADVTSFLYWLYADVWGAIDDGVDLLARTDDADIALIAKGILWDVGCWTWSKRKHSEDYAGMGDSLQPSVERIFKFLFERATAKPAMLTPLFAEVLFRSAWIAYDGREAELPSEARVFLIALAKKELGRLRVELGRQTAETTGAFIDAQADHIRAVAHTLFSLSTLWEGMKPLWLLVRASKIPLFGHDLSWWTTAAPMQNNGVAALAQYSMYFFIAYSQLAQSNDEDLADFRRELASFCLERLKTNKKGDGPNEPNALWRVAAIRAAGELGVNPDGKGHHLLHHARKNDPDEGVRTAADGAYQRMVDVKGLPQNVPPQKAVLNALWWLRQAQLAALDVHVDERGAQITRAKEIRFTKLKKHLPGEGITDDKQRKENA